MPARMTACTHRLHLAEWTLLATDSPHDGIHPRREPVDHEKNANQNNKIGDRVFDPGRVFDEGHDVVEEEDDEPEQDKELDVLVLFFGRHQGSHFFKKTFVLATTNGPVIKSNLVPWNACNKPDAFQCARFAF